jgi:hypothetical protein
MSAADGLTVLHSVDGKYATKRIVRYPKTGKIDNHGYDKAFWFKVETVAAGNFAGLAATLYRLALLPYAFVIRGAPLPGINLHYTKRRFRPHGGEPATFGAAMRYWLAIDMDHVEAPLTDPAADPEGAVEHLIGLLPAELRDGSCWWQFTSSQSLHGNGLLSARLWFWNEVPLADADLKRWAIRGLVDPSLYQPTQPHYIAAPLFDGMADPLPRRCGVRRGLEDTVSLVIPPPASRDPETVGGWAPGRGAEAYIAEIGKPHFREPIKSAIASFVAVHGSKADASMLKERIRAAIAAADAGRRPRDVIERYASDEHLDDLIKAIRAIHGDRPGVGERTPVITVKAGKRHKAADDGIAALVAHGVPIYAQGQRLAQLAQNRP